MRNRSGRWGLVLCLGGAVAAAHEIEMVPREYRPTLALIEVVASDFASIERAQQLEAQLLPMLSEQFEPVTSPSQVREKLGELELSCSEVACFEAVQTRLQVQRIARITVEEQAGASRVTLLALNPAAPEVIRVEIDRKEHSEVFKNLILRSPAQRDLDFLQTVLPELREAFRELAAPNAKLIVENPDPGLTVLIDGKAVGIGRYEITRQPAALWVSISGPRYEPFAQLVRLKPAEALTVDLRPVLTKRTYKGVMSRPAIYVAISGLTFLAVGMGFALAALEVQSRLVAGGDPVPVTRLEAMSAPNNGLMAGLLMGTGVALSAFGITWVAITPSKYSNADAWSVSLGGKFY